MADRAVRNAARQTVLAYLASAGYDPTPERVDTVLEHFLATGRFEGAPLLTTDEEARREFNEIKAGGESVPSADPDKALPPVDPSQVVFDGDTFIVPGHGPVRLIGVDTSESVREGVPLEFFGKEASDFTKRLVGNQPIRIEYDGETVDKYGRTLGYAYLPDGTNINAELIRQGYAHAYTLFPHAKMEEFRKLEQDARLAHRGIWGAESLAERGITEVDHPLGGIDRGEVNPRGIAETLKDVGVDVGRGVLGIGSDLASLVAPGGTVADVFAGWDQALAERQSAAHHRGAFAVGEAETAGEMASALLDHPGQPLSIIARSFPYTLAGGFAGRAAGALIRRPAAGVLAGHGGIAGLSEAAAMRREGYSPGEAIAAGARVGAGVAALGGAGRGLARALGAADIEDVLTLGRRLPGARVPAAALSEAAEEAAQEGWQAFVGNMARGADAFEGMGPAMVAGAVAGAGMAVPGGALGAARDVAQRAREQEVERKKKAEEKKAAEKRKRTFQPEDREALTAAIGGRRAQYEGVDAEQFRFDRGAVMLEIADRLGTKDVPAELNRVVLSHLRNDGEDGMKLAIQAITREATRAQLRPKLDEQGREILDSLSDRDLRRVWKEADAAGKARGLAPWQLRAENQAYEEDALRAFVLSKIPRPAGGAEPATWSDVGGAMTPAQMDALLAAEDRPAPAKTSETLRTIENLLTEDLTGRSVGEFVRSALGMSMSQDRAAFAAQAAARAFKKIEQQQPTLPPRPQEHRVVQEGDDPDPSPAKVRLAQPRPGGLLNRSQWERRRRNRLKTDLPDPGPWPYHAEVDAEHEAKSVYEPPVDELRRAQRDAEFAAEHLKRPVGTIPGSPEQRRDMAASIALALTEPDGDLRAEIDVAAAAHRKGITLEDALGRPVQPLDYLIDAARRHVVAKEEAERAERAGVEVPSADLRPTADLDTEAPRGTSPAGAGTRGMGRATEDVEFEERAAVPGEVRRVATQEAAQVFRDLEPATEAEAAARVQAFRAERAAGQAKAELRPFDLRRAKTMVSDAVAHFNAQPGNVGAQRAHVASLAKTPETAPFVQQMWTVVRDVVRGDSEPGSGRRNLALYIRAVEVTTTAVRARVALAATGPPGLVNAFDRISPLERAMILQGHIDKPQAEQDQALMAAAQVLYDRETAGTAASVAVREEARVARETDAAERRLVEQAAAAARADQVAVREQGVVTRVPPLGQQPMRLDPERRWDRPPSETLLGRSVGEFRGPSEAEAALEQETTARAERPTDYAGVDPGTVQLDFTLMDSLVRAFGARLAVDPATTQEGRTERGKAGDRRTIWLSSDLFKPENRDRLAKTLAHELWHAREFREKGPDDPTLFKMLDTVAADWEGQVATAAKSAAVKRELKALSNAWRAAPANPPPGYAAYRDSLREQSADFFSALLVDPTAAKKFAPVTFDAVINGMDEASWTAFGEIQKELAGDLDLRGQHIQHAMDLARVRANETRQQQLDRKQAARREAFRNPASMLTGRAWSTVFRKFVDFRQPLFELGKRAAALGVVNNPDAVAWNNARNYSEDPVVFTLAQVSDIVNRAGLGEEHLHRRLAYRQIAKGVVIDTAKLDPDGDYEGVPLRDLPVDLKTIHTLSAFNIDAAGAAQALEAQDADLQPAQVEALNRAADLLEAQLRSYVPRLLEEGIITRERAAALDATDGAFPPLLLTTLLNSRATGNTIHKASTADDPGSFVQLAQDNMLFMEQLLSTTRGKRTTVRAVQGIAARLGESGPAELGRDDVQYSTTAQAWEMTPDASVRNPDGGLLSVMLDGELKHFVVDEAIAAVYRQRKPPSYAPFLNAVLGIFNRGNLIWEPAWIMKNLVADMSRAFILDPDYGVAGLPKFLGHLGRSLPAAAQARHTAVERARMLEDPGVSETKKERIRRFNEAVNAGAVPTYSRADVAAAGFEPDDPKGVDAGLLFDDPRLSKTPKGYASRLVEAVDAVFNPVIAISEALPKLSAYERDTAAGRAMDLERVRFIRETLGSPDYAIKGEWGWQMNALVRFFNSNVQGMRGDLKAIKANKTNTLAKLTMFSLAPAVLLELARVGAFGTGGGDDDTYSWYTKALRSTAPDERRAYMTIPVGFDEETQKGTVLRIPYAYTAVPVTDWIVGAFDRWEYGARDNPLHYAKEVVEMGRSVMGNIPGADGSMGPEATTIWQTFQLMSGKNPWIPFYQDHVFDDEEWEGLTRVEKGAKFFLEFVPDTFGFSMAGGAALRVSPWSQVAEPRPGLMQSFVEDAQEYSGLERFFRESDRGKMHERIRRGEQQRAERARRDAADMRWLRREARDYGSPSEVDVGQVRALSRRYVGERAESGATRQRKATMVREAAQALVERTYPWMEGVWTGRVEMAPLVETYGRETVRGAIRAARAARALSEDRAKLLSKRMGR